MKRLSSLCLAACLLCAAFGGAAAAKGDALRVIDKNSMWAQEYQETYPDRAIETVEVACGDDEDSNRKQLLQSGDWDVAQVRVG
jgi:spermidine/putrescine-binding protein